jgi:hypothetical protein
MLDEIQNDLNRMLLERFGNRKLDDGLRAEVTASVGALLHERFPAEQLGALLPRVTVDPADRNRLVIQPPIRLLLMLQDLNGGHWPSTQPRYGTARARRCGRCIFLAHANDFDLWFCAAEPTLLARGSGEPGGYTSGMEFGKVQSDSGELGPLGLAYRLALEDGLVIES